ncbi:peptidase associated/transthyretin-like domain-containing protein [Peristeroidobacter soli]|uniref:PEGA domain-containing protein n=1 Tax=Peristeroidobacter soli TaxID=2497877 RepID=UPI00101CD700|nr:PEGA domain-containing protein [Peristeroidobacter soli]
MSRNGLVRSAVAFGILGASLFAGGCASIVNGGNREISIATQPPGATASVRKSGGGIADVVAVEKTPCTISLDPKKSYFSGQSYTLRLELPGYKVTEVELTPKMSGWYWGNLLFGGLIGMLAVDPATGAMWNIAPEKIDRKLTGGQAELIKNNNGFVVVLESELTPAERLSMVRVN